MRKHVRRGDPQRRQQWKAAVEQWQNSGQTVRDYCRVQGLKESAFYFWRQKLTREVPEGDGGQPMRRASRGEKSPAPSGRRTRNRRIKARFLPVQVVPGRERSEACGVEIMVGNRRVVRVEPGFDRQVLADVLAVLEARPC